MTARFLFLPVLATILFAGCATSTLLTAPNSRPEHEKKRLVDRPGVVVALLPFALALDIATSPLIPFNIAVAEVNRAISRPTAVDERAVLKIARRAVAGRESWPHGGEFTAARRTNDWVVTAWRIDYPKNKGASRFVPGDFISITIDRNGKVSQYIHGH